MSELQQDTAPDAGPAPAGVDTGAAGTTPEPDPIHQRLDELTDLFRRRLVDDRNAKTALDTLHQQLDQTRSLTQSHFLLPVARRLFHVIDRLEPVGEEFAASIADELIDILAMQGITRIEHASTAFDPTTQEVVAIVPTTDPQQDGQVIAIRRVGWRLDSRILRPALVEVGRLTEPQAVD